MFIPGLKQGASYKYNVRSRFAGYQQLKADPYAFYCETPPKSASVVCNSHYEWNDAAWMETRAGVEILKSPLAVYEVHLESWLRGPQGQPLSYREMAEVLGLSESNVGVKLNRIKTQLAQTLKGTEHEPQ